MTQATATPISNSLSAIQLAFESTMRPVVSSSPVDRMAARSIIASSSGERQEEPRSGSGIETGHQVVTDDAEAPRHSPVDQARRPRLRHVEDAEQHEDQRRGTPGAG